MQPPDPHKNRQTDQRTDRKYLTRLTGFGFVSGIIYAAIVLVWMYVNDAARSDVLWVVGLYWIAAIVWLFAIRCALQVRESKRALLSVMFVFAICFRAVQMFGTPIMELDVYRYMWDGIVVSHGISPYEYSPAAVLADEIALNDTRLERLTKVASASPAHHAILSTVHFPEYTTIYPPISQAVFAAAMWMVPDSANVLTHLFVMRLTLVIFDMATLIAVVGLIRITQLHTGWALAYAWNPLVIKEVANSAHVDAIAVFFVTMALLVALRGIGRPASPRGIAVLAALLLALGVGAKLYPVILAPIFFVFIAKKSFGNAICFATGFALVSGLLLVVMIPRGPSISEQGSQRNSQPEAAAQVAHAQHEQKQRNGLVGFLSQWRMNDLAFSVVYENAQIRSNGSVDNRPWYSVVPDKWRVRWQQWVGRSDTGGSAAFRLARFVTLGLFTIIATGILIRLWRTPCDAQSVLNAAFFFLVTFLLLQPTFNPWYCLWATPFVCFVKNRGWLLLGPLLLTYYLRFWFRANEVELALGSYTFTGTGIFHHCVVWLEYGAVAACLVLFWLLQGRHHRLKHCND